MLPTHHSQPRVTEGQGATGWKCPQEPAPHWAVESRASHAQVSSSPGSEVHGTSLQAPTHEKTHVSLYPLPVGSNHVRSEYLFPDFSTPVPLQSAHFTQSRTEDILDFLLCNEPHELKAPWRGEQNLSIADETETFASQRGQFCFVWESSTGKSFIFSKFLLHVKCSKQYLAKVAFQHVTNYSIFISFFPLQPLFKNIFAHWRLISWFGNTGHTWQSWVRGKTVLLVVHAIPHWIFLPLKRGLIQMKSFKPHNLCSIIIGLVEYSS